MTQCNERVRRGRSRYETSADVQGVQGRWRGREGGVGVVVPMGDGLMHMEREEEGVRHDLFMKFTNQKLVFVC